MAALNEGIPTAHCSMLQYFVDSWRLSFRNEPKLSLFYHQFICNRSNQTNHILVVFVFKYTGIEVFKKLPSTLSIRERLQNPRIFWYVNVFLLLKALSSWWGCLIIFTSSTFISNFIFCLMLHSTMLYGIRIFRSAA